jgi:hypothetical protein
MYRCNALSRRLVVPGILVLCLGGIAVTSPQAQEAPKPSTAASSPGTRSYSPAAIHALPGLQCSLCAAGSTAADRLPVFSDADGYVRFLAVRAVPGDAVQKLALDCKDATGKTSSYTADLASDSTFAPRPLNLADEPGTDRPALKGDPLGYTQAELVAAGYGLRPDPVKDAAAYAQWLEAASPYGHCGPWRALGRQRDDRGAQLHLEPGGVQRAQRDPRRGSDD